VCCVYAKLTKTLNICAKVTSKKDIALSSKAGLKLFLKQYCNSKYLIPVFLSLSHKERRAFLRLLSLSYTCTSAHDHDEMFCLKNVGILALSHSCGLS
jgi:hypothetical protein